MKSQTNYRIVAILHAFVMYTALQLSFTSESKAGEVAVGSESVPGANLKVTGDLEGKGKGISASVTCSFEINVGEMQKNITLSEVKITQNTEVHKREYKWGGGVIPKVKATVRVYPLKKVKKHWESEITLTVRVNDDKVAHPTVTLRW